MGAPGSPNELWARALAAKWLPGEPFRWELYDRLLRECLSEAGRWCDLGAGRTDFTVELAHLAQGVAVDLHAPARPAGLFVAADLGALPFREGSFDAAALRFVVEHLEEPQAVFDECGRVLAPGGRLLVITTNRRSFALILSGLLPGPFRRYLISRLYRVPPSDVLPAIHRWNTPAGLASPREVFTLERMEFVEALDWTRRWLFLLLLGLAFLTRPRVLRKFRSNILAVYRRRPTGE